MVLHCPKASVGRLRTGSWLETSWCMGGTRRLLHLGVLPGLRLARLMASETALLAVCGVLATSCRMSLVEIHWAAPTGLSHCCSLVYRLRRVTLVVVQAVVQVRCYDATRAVGQAVNMQFSIFHFFQMVF